MHELLKFTVVQENMNAGEVIQAISDLQEQVYEVRKTLKKEAKKWVEDEKFGGTFTLTVVMGFIPNDGR